MSVVERDYFKARPEKECYSPHCFRPPTERGLCEVHYAAVEADSAGFEAEAAVKELLPPMIMLADAVDNRYLRDALKDLSSRTSDYVERKYLERDLLHAEAKMNEA